MDSPETNADLAKATAPGATPGPNRPPVDPSKTPSPPFSSVPVETKTSLTEAPVIKEMAGQKENLCESTPRELLVNKNSVFKDSEEEAERHKWIESEKAGADLGENAIRQWVKCHWWGYLRARWLEHLQGTKFWVELDRGDFGLIQRLFVQHGALLDRIVDRLKAGQENLDIINWARDFHLDTGAVIDILEALDMNSRRLAHKFDP